MGRRWLQISLAFATLLCSSAFASSPTGTITGTITDPSGAVVNKARVIVRNEDTNAIRDAETNDDGDYTVALLASGPVSGFRREQGFRRSIFTGSVWMWTRRCALTSRCESARPPKK